MKIYAILFGLFTLSMSSNCSDAPPSDQSNTEIMDSDTSTHQHTNMLVHETSPYLLQHAHNPVDWHPWNEETLEKARREIKLIIISVGYSACHWCHVLEH